jgi:hypothetical protein
MTTRDAAREGALLHPRTDLGAFAVTGKDRLTWLNGLVTCDLAKLKPGAGAVHDGAASGPKPRAGEAGAYGLAVGKTGKIAAELWFVAGADHVVVIVARDRLESIRAHFDKHLIMEDAEMSDPLDRAVLFAHGPRARDLVDAARIQKADAALVDWTGRGDAAVIVAAEGALDATRDALLAAAGAHAAIADEDAWEAIRVEWGLPKLGVDYDEQTLPQEASLEKVAVSFEKGCYLGQETVFMLEKRGHAKKKLMRIAIEGADLPAKAAEIVLPEDGAVGSVTSVARAPEGGAIALGYVKYKHAVAGQALTVEGRPARVLGFAAEPRKAGA